MRNRITLCENTLDPLSWQTYYCGDVREFLKNHYNKYPKNAKLYLNHVAKNCDVTPYNEATVDRLGKLNGHFFLVIEPEGFLVVLVIVAVALSAVSVLMSYLMRPSLPANQQSGSPTNSLTARENRQRIGERIPDIFGVLWATPDLIQVPYNVYIGNKKVEYSCLCIGRGKFQIVNQNIREEVTPLIEIAGASCEVYGPYTSPNSGDEPQLRIGDPIKEPLTKIKPVSSINGQLLIAPNANKIKGAKNIRFVAGGSIECNDTAIDFTDYFTPSTQANPQYLIISNWSTYAGTYQILDVDSSTIVLSNPGAINSNWNSIGTYTSWGSPVLTRSGSNWVGPYYITDNTVTKLICNFVCLQGLYETDSEGNQHAMTAKVQIEVYSIDSVGDIQGNPVYYDCLIKGSADLKGQIGATLKAVLPEAGACRVRARRVSNTDLRDRWQVVDNIQFEAMYSSSPITKTHFGNVTIIQTLTWPTPSALSVKSRKLNVLVNGIIENQINSTWNEPTIHTFDADYPSGSGVLAPNWVIDENNCSQTANSKPTICVGDKVLGMANNDVVEWKAHITNTGDDDFIGFVFGYQDTSHFYLFQWKGATQETTYGTATEGMSIKKISGAITGANLWPDGATSGCAVLQAPTGDGWAEDTNYYFRLSLLGISGVAQGFKIEIFSDSARTVLIDSFEINDTTYSSGKFGFYCYSQANCIFENVINQQQIGWVTPDEISAADIICAMALDPAIGRRVESEIDREEIYNLVGLGGEVSQYFGTDLAVRFGYTFDDAKVSFEEMLSQVCQAIFCIPYRRGNIISLFFEKLTEDSTILFNHRNKIPGTETRTVGFGPSSENDGIDLEYVELNSPGSPNVDTPAILHFPQDESAVAPRKITAIGIRSKVQAWFLGCRLYNKMRLQHTAVQFEATKEAGLCIVGERILVADNVRSGTQDGEIIAQNVLELTLSQKVVFAENHEYTIFIQHYDATVEAIGITAGSKPNKVILAQAPAAALVLDPKKYARTTYVIVDNADGQKGAFLLKEKEAKNGATYEIKAINYDPRYYANDTDYINNLIDNLTPPGAGSGYSKSAFATVYVDGRCQPWNIIDNPSYTFGINRGKPPVAVDIQTPEGSTVSISASLPGQIAQSVFVGFNLINIPTNTVRYDNDDDPSHYDDAEGDPNVITGQNLASGDGWSNKRYPTYYATSPALGRAGLMGCWAKKNTPTTGKYQVIAPFVIGLGGNFTVPAGGVDTLLLGINDAKHSDNDGGFQVTITQANDTAGDAAGQDTTPDTTTTNPNETIWDFTVNGA